MNGLKDRLLDILLFPVKWYERLTDKKPALYAGILLIGAADLLLPDVSGVFRQLFHGKPENAIYFNAVAFALMIVLLGTIDVIFVSVPLFDFFKFLKKKEEAGLASLEEKPEITPHIASHVKVMKVYLLSQIYIFPVSMLLYFLFWSHVKPDSPAWMQSLLLITFLLTMIWTAAIITRGINSLFRFIPIFGKLTFIIVFTWYYLFGIVFDEQIMYWLLKIFR
jgi:hypothetical protein